MDGDTKTTDPCTKTKGFIYTGPSYVIILNFQKDRLTLYPEPSTLTFDPAVGEREKKERGTRFTIETYDDFAGDRNKPLVAICCGIGNRKYILCVEGNLLILKEGELPEEIPSDSREFIFYQQNLDYDEDSNTFATFESSVESGSFLACSDDGRNLILKPHTGDEVDKTAKFLLITSETNSGSAFIINQTTETFGKNGAYYIWNSFDDLLVARPKESTAIFESDGHANEEQTTFYVTWYKELASSPGLPAAFSCKVDNRNYFLCVDNNAVIIKEGELPEKIEAKTSELIFYIRQFSTGQPSYRIESSLKFEPSVEQRFCLGWKKDDPKRKLILKAYNEGVINEAINVFLQRKD